MIDVLMDRRSRTGRQLKYLVNQIPGEGWINWTGRQVGDQVGPCLNRMTRADKLAQLTWCQMQGVNVVPFSICGPGDGQWLPRLRHHTQGRDLVDWRGRPVGLRDPDYWTKYIHFDDEWRVLVFNGKILRSGLKLPRQRDFHPWVKSHRMGWKISYIGGAPLDARTQAKAAVAALNLDFGAVDIGMDAHGKAWVLEVNTCPGMDGGTMAKFVDEVRKWSEAQS